MADDYLKLWINKDGAGSGSSPELDTLVLGVLARAPVPAPVELEVGRTSAVSGWDDPKLAKALARGKAVTTMRAPGIRVDRLLGDRLVWTVDLRLPEDPTAAASIRDLFVDLCAAIGATYGRGHLANHQRALYDEHYAQNNRTFYANGLYWLSWFGPGELERQGGIRALSANPHARVRRIADSLLIEVGSSYLDATTPAGVDRLLAATAALPPMGASPTDESFVPMTVHGQHGMFDPDAHAFWINVHLEPGHHLSESRVAEIAALPGQGAPPVSQVNVLFSSEETARAEGRALLRVGVGIWYVDDKTGLRTPL